MIVVRGAGDVGSSVAHALYSAGYAVALHDLPAPAHTRRGMSFADALFDGKAELAGVLAKRARSLDDLARMADCHRAVPVSAAQFEAMLAALHPDVLVDARMRKRERPGSLRGLAPLTIGLGPNFEAGLNVDLAVETGWGEDLGTVLRSGRTRVLEGEPQEIAGHARDRYLYAPLSGDFRTRFGIGDAVAKGEEIARIADTPLLAPLTGCLRGLTHDGVTVCAGTKVIEVDPRGFVEAAHGIGERPRRIAQSVLQAVRDRSA